MEDDSRIVQGGELNVERLENVVDTLAPASPSVSAPQVSPNVDFGSNYTLNEALVKFLQHLAMGDISNINPSINADFNVGDRTRHPVTNSVVTSLGADFFTLDNFRLFPTKTLGESYLIADLSLANPIPHNSFEKGLATLLGAEETAKYVLSTDIGKTLGLDDHTKPVDLNDQPLRHFFPELSQVRHISDSYVVPRDPYIFLLAFDLE